MSNKYNTQFFQVIFLLMKEAENCESNYMIGWCNGQCNNDVHALAHSLGSQARMIINFLKWINSFSHPSIHPSNAKMWTSERAIPLCLECRPPHHINLHMKTRKMWITWNAITWEKVKWKMHSAPDFTWHVSRGSAAVADNLSLLFYTLTCTYCAMAL